MKAARLSWARPSPVSSMLPSRSWAWGMPLARTAAIQWLASSPGKAAFISGAVRSDMSNARQECWGAVGWRLWRGMGQT